MKKYFLLLLVSCSCLGNTIWDVSCPPPFKSCQNPKTVLVPISPGLLLYLQYHKAHKTEDTILKLDFFYDYQISNNSNDIAAHLYGNNVIDICQDYEHKSWNPQYFGLGADTNISTSIKPIISNQIFNIEIGYQNNDGFWAQVDIPVTYSIWELKTGTKQGNLGSELLQKDGTIFLQADQSGVISGGTNLTNLTIIDSAEKANAIFNELPGTSSTLTDNSTNTQTIGVGKASQLDTILTPLSEANGSSFSLKPNTTASLHERIILPPKDLATALDGYTYGNLTTYQYNKIPLFFSRETNTAWKIANILVMCGWDKKFSNAATAGIYAKCILPSGSVLNKEWSTYSFSPVVGNGDRLQLGGGIEGFYTCYENDQYSFTFHGDCYATYVFPSNQWRSCDRINNPLSRYIIVKEFNNTLDYTGHDFALGDKNANFYNISNNIQAEGVFNILYRYKHFTVDYGYTFIYLSKEKASTNCHTNSNPSMYYGYKGNTMAQNILISGTPAAGTPWNINTTSISLNQNNNVSLENSIFYNPNLSTPATQENLFILPEPINESGLMDAQLLEKLFIKSTYVFEGKHAITIGGFVTYGFSPKKFFTVASCEMGISVGGLF